jgi:Transposase DDE domain
MSTPSRHRQILYQWADVLSQRLPLSKPQALGLALWSIGIVLAESGSLTGAALALSIWLGWPRSNLLKRLREWYLEAEAKKGQGTQGRGKKRCDWQVEDCAPALGPWILADWPSPSVVLVLDATAIQDRFTVLAVSMVYRRSAIPLLWTVLPGNTPEAWQPHWERMLGQLADAIGGPRFVLVLTDRGLYSPRLFEAIVRVGWHPLMRIRAQGYYRPAGQSAWIPLANLRPRPNQQEAWTGDAFKNAEGRLACTLVAWWTEGHAEPWLLLTDLAEERVRGCWYGLRGWIEQSFKRLKSAGWDCEQTRMSDAGRVQRHWLALAVATLWTLSVGGQAEAEEEAKTAPEGVVPGEARWLEALADPAIEEPDPSAAVPAVRADGAASASRTVPSPWGHTISVFRLGWTILSQALSGGRLLRVHWHPESLIKPVMARAGFS